MTGPYLASATTFNFSGSSAMLVDENAAFMDVISQILLGFGFRAFHRCDRLEEGIQRSRDVNVDLTLIDPFPNPVPALQLIRDLRQRERHNPSPQLVIVMTGQARRELVASVHQHGADYVVIKPFSPAVLLERILWSATRPAEEGRRGLQALPPQTRARVS